MIETGALLFEPYAKERSNVYQPMTYPQQPKNIKVCPECGNSLINTALRCTVCGYRFANNYDTQVNEESRLRKPLRLAAVTMNLPVLLGLIILFLAGGALIYFGMQKREQMRTLVAAEEATATFIATTYVSPTPPPTATFTPLPPTETPEVDIEYTVASGDSCLSIAKRFNLYLDSILIKNDIDCGALQIGTVLKIPHPTATPEATSTASGTATH